jgi:phage terminase small subunit
MRMQGYLQRKVANIQDKTEISASEVLRECTRIALADPLGAFNDDGTLKRIQDIPIDLRHTICSFEVDELWDGTGKDKTKIGEVKKIKFWSKDKQIEHLLRYKGLFEKDNRQQQQAPPTLVIKQPEDANGG